MKRVQPVGSPERSRWATASCISLACSHGNVSHAKTSSIAVFDTLAPSAIPWAKFIRNRAINPLQNPARERVLRNHSGWKLPLSATQSLSVSKQTQCRPARIISRSDLCPHLGTSRGGTDQSGSGLRLEQNQHRCPRSGICAVGFFLAKNPGWHLCRWVQLC